MAPSIILNENRRPITAVDWEPTAAKVLEEPGFPFGMQRDNPHPNAGSGSKEFSGRGHDFLR